MEAKRCSPGVGQKLRPLSRTLSEFLKGQINESIFLFNL